MKKDKAHGQAALMCLLLAMCTVIFAPALCGPLQPLLDKVGEQAVFLAAATNMPEGTVSMLKEHFKGYVTEEIPPKSEEPLQPPELLIPEPQPPTEPPPPIDHSLPAPVIDKKYRRELIEETMLGSASSVCQSIGAGWLSNYSHLESSKIEKLLKTPADFTPLADGTVEVLIFHTHATESFENYDAKVYDNRNDWRSTDNGSNMVAVGEVLTLALQDAGIGVIHDSTQHDYPSYNGSYERSAATVKAYQKKYPKLKLILDLHRDGIKRDEAIVKPATVIDGKKAAQLMLISACDNGKLGVPSWADNMRLACAVTNAIEEDFPTLTRPVFLANGRYNMHLSSGALLMEVGSQGNTLEEAMYTAELVGKSLADFIKASANK